jgi:hypothetical protein
MTAHARARKPGRPDLNHLQHLRLFSPAATIEATARGVDSPELDAQLAIIAGFLKHARDPHCLLCVRPIGLDPPSLMACLDAPASHEWPSWSARRAAIIRKPSRKSSTRSARQCRTAGARRTAKSGRGPPPTRQADLAVLGGYGGAGNSSAEFRLRRPKGCPNSFARPGGR